MNNQGQITTAYLNFSYSYTIPTSPPTPTQLLQSVTLLDPIGHTNTFTRTYSYDSMNRLTNAEVFNSSNQEVQDWGYSYDTAGNRKTASVFYPSTTTNYYYNGAEELTSTVQLNGTSDTYSGLDLSYETMGGNTTYYTRCSCGMLVDEKLPSGSKYYYLFDGLGSAGISR